MVVGLANWRAIFDPVEDSGKAGWPARLILLTAIALSVCSAGALTLPVLVIAGERDEIAPASGQHLFIEQVPGAQLVMLPGVGHLVHYEQPEAAADAIRRFLS